MTIPTNPKMEKELINIRNFFSERETRIDLLLNSFIAMTHQSLSLHHPIEFYFLEWPKNLMAGCALRSLLLQAVVSVPRLFQAGGESG